MIRSLVAIYHSRIDYPGYVPPTSGQFRITKDGIEPAGEKERADDSKLKYRNPADIPVSPGGEIEDEAIDRSNENVRSKKSSAP
jgi:hypothetical protein